MQRHKHVLIVLWLIGGIILSRSVFGKPAEDILGDILIVEGMIDDIILSDIEDKKEHLFVTHLVFSSGQGIFLIGTHPGLSKGKTVWFRARLFIVISGISYYEMIRTSPGAPPEPKKPEKPGEPGSP